MKLPRIVIYSDNLPNGIDGDALMFIVRIRNQYRNDHGILAHEDEHVKQWYTCFAAGIITSFMLWVLAYSMWPITLVLGVGAHSIMYSLVDRYRLWSEVAAYRVQANYFADDRRELFASFIASRYRLSISASDAEVMLRN